MGMGTVCPIHHGSAVATGHPASALGLAWPKAGGGGEGTGGFPPTPDAPSPTRLHRPAGACSTGCVTAPPPFLPVSCDFERDMCGWSSPSDPRLHSFAWGWKSGVPLAKYPSPEQDHTLGTRNGRKHPSLPGHPGMARVRKRIWGWMGGHSWVTSQGGPGSTASLSPPHLRGTTWSQKQ